MRAHILVAVLFLQLLALPVNAQYVAPNKSPSLRDLQATADRSIRDIDRKLEANRARAAEIDRAADPEALEGHADAARDIAERNAKNIGNAVSPSATSKAKAGAAAAESVADVATQRRIEGDFVGYVTGGLAEQSKLTDERRELQQLKSRMVSLRGNIVTARRNIAAKREQARELAQLAKEQAVATTAKAARVSNGARDHEGGRAGDRNGGRGFEGRADGPKSDGPKSDGPKSDGPKSDGPKSDGPKSDGPKSDGPEIRLH